MKIIGILGTVILLSFYSCQKHENKDNSEEARELFNKSAFLINEFTDKIASAQDSLTVDSLQQLFEKRIVDLNFSFSPETDYKLTEEENDSIFYLMSRMKNITHLKLEEFSIQVPDSLITE